MIGFNLEIHVLLSQLVLLLSVCVCVCVLAVVVEATTTTDVAKPDWYPSKRPEFVLLKVVGAIAWRSQLYQQILNENKWPICSDSQPVGFICMFATLL